MPCDVAPLVHPVLADGRGDEVGSMVVLTDAEAARVAELLARVVPRDDVERVELPELVARLTPLTPHLGSARGPS